MVLWFVGSFAVGVWAVRQVAAHPPSKHWADTALRCAKGNPLFMAHLRRVAFEDLREPDAHIEFSLLLAMVDAERGRELGRRMGGMLLAELNGQNAQAWAANPWAVYNWVMLLEPLVPEISVDVAQAGLGVVPQSHLAHAELHRIVDFNLLPSGLRRIDPTLRLQVPESHRRGVEYNMRFHPTEPALVVDSRGGLLSFDLETGEMSERVANQYVTDFAIDPSGETVAFLDDNTPHVHFHDWETGDDVGRWEVTNAEPLQMHFLTPDALLVHWKYAQPNMQIWSLSAGAAIGGYAVSEEPTATMTFDFSEGRFACRWYWGPQVTVHDAWDGNLIGSPLPLLPRLASFALIDHGQSALLLDRGAGANGSAVSLAVWDVGAGAMSQSVTSESAVGVGAIDLHRDSHVGVLDSNRGFLIFDRESLAPVAILSATFTSFPANAVSPDGTMAAIGSNHGEEILVYDLTVLDDTDPRQ